MAMDIYARIAKMLELLTEANAHAGTGLFSLAKAYRQSSLPLPTYRKAFELDTKHFTATVTQKQYDALDPYARAGNQAQFFRTASEMVWKIHDASAQFVLAATDAMIGDALAGNCPPGLGCCTWPIGGPNSLHCVSKEWCDLQEDDPLNTEFEEGKICMDHIKPSKRKPKARMGKKSR